MLGRGVKRKWRHLEAETVQATEQAGLQASASRCDRACLLHLCLDKLQRLQAGVELSLRRSVLLINTLRQIQDDVRYHGGNDTLLDDDSRLLRESVGGVVAITCPGCADDDAPSTPRLPEFSCQEAKSLQEQDRALPATTVNAFNDPINAVGDLSDLALDDIFEDIDTSMYETSELPATWASPLLWSTWVDEDVKGRSVGHAPDGRLEACLMDLNELDHIMEILVKS